MSLVHNNSCLERLFNILEDPTAESIEELNKSISEIITCAVCLEPLRPRTVICVKGHAICEDCKGDMMKCPTCRQNFSNLESTGFIQQLLEVLPHTCRYQPCTETVARGDDHELFCKFKPTKCRRCAWNGHGKDLADHIKQSHGKILLASNCTITDYEPNEKRTSVGIFFAFDHLLWHESSNNPETGVVTNKFFPVLLGKPNHDFFIKLAYKSTSGNEYITSIKLQLNKRENCILVPNSILTDFIDSKKQLKYNLIFTKTSTV